MGKIRPYILAFLVGAGILIMELAGSRLVAPIIGSSIVVWAVLIAVVLGGISLGSWLGGLASGRVCAPKLLLLFAATASVSVALIPCIAEPLLRVLTFTAGVGQVEVLVGCTAVFVVPSVALGSLYPFFLAEVVTSADSAGRQGGALSAISTLGSICGSLGAGLILFDYIGTHAIFFVVAGFLLLVVIVAALKVYSRGALFLVGITCVIIGLLFYFDRSSLRAAEGRGRITFDTPYTYGYLVDQTRSQQWGLGPEVTTVRMLVTDPYGVQAAVLPDSPDTTLVDYIRAYRLGPELRPEARNILVLGAGGYTAVRDLLKVAPNAVIWAVEKDPGITAISRDKLFLEDSARLRIIHEDARTFLNRESGAQVPLFDIVVVDVFGGSAVPPFYMTTVETFTQVKGKIVKNGIMVMNVLGRWEHKPDGHVARTLAAIREVFLEARAIPLGDPQKMGNIMVVASDELSQQGLEKSEVLAERAVYEVDRSLDISLFRDDFAPVENLVARELYRGPQKR